MNENDLYTLNWNNYPNHIQEAFDSLFSKNEFIDVTLSCEGKMVGAHKVLLSACSTYFYELFRNNPCQHPIVILKDVRFQDIIDILKYVYNGKVSITTENLDSFIKTGELLQISGLTKSKDKFDDLNNKIEMISVNKSVVKENIKKTKKKKRNLGNSCENISLKKKKEDKLQTEFKIKEEDDNDMLDSEEEHCEDPLEINQQDEETFINNMLSSEDRLYENNKSENGSNQFKKIKAFHSLIKPEGPGRKKRKICIQCYKHFRNTLSSREADRKSRRVVTYCKDCKNQPGFCIPCFNRFHKSLLI